MFDLNVISTWTVDEAIAEVHVRLPPGWSLRLEEEPHGFFHSLIVDAEGKLQWESPAAPERTPGAGLRVVVLDAYGWLYARQHQPKHPKWALRPDLTPAAVNARFGLTAAKPGQQVPDPGDLDPNEIEQQRKNHTPR